MPPELSRQALADADRARDELAVEYLSADEFRYRFRVAIALLMAVTTTVVEEVGNAAPKGWLEPLLAPHSSQLMKLRNPVLKHNKPPATPKSSALVGQLFKHVDTTGQIVGGHAETIGIFPTDWTWDSGPYAGQRVLDVIDLYLGLLRDKVLPQAEKYIN